MQKLSDGTVRIRTYQDQENKHKIWWDKHVFVVTFILVLFDRRVSSTKGRLQSKIVFCQRSSSIKGRLPSRSSSIKGCLPLKVIFHHRPSSIKNCLSSKVIFHLRSSSIEGRFPAKVVFHLRMSTFIWWHQMCSRLDWSLTTFIFLTTLPPPTP